MPFSVGCSSYKKRNSLITYNAIHLNMCLIIEISFSFRNWKCSIKKPRVRGDCSKGNNSCSEGGNPE